MKIFRWRFRRMNLAERERELRAAGQMLEQLRPRSVLRDVRDLALKFERDEVFREYVLSRIWAVLPVVLVFIFVSTVCSIDIMFRVGRYLPDPPLWVKPFALLVGAGTWVCGLAAQIYVFLIWLEERATQQNRLERGVRVEVPAGLLAYLKYSRALPPWILIFACIVLPTIIMARRAPLVALLLISVSMLAPYLFKKFDSR
jgi:hypothetical protein